jgi:hypothetical protein
VDNLGARSKPVDPPGHPIVEPCAKGHQKVGFLHGGHRGEVAMHTGHTQTQVMPVREGTPGHKRGHHVDAAQLDQFAQHFGGPGLEDSAAHVENRTFGGPDQIGGRFDG